MTDHDQSVSPVSLVGSLDTAVLPVSPVQVVSQQAEPEGMRKILVRHNFPVRAVQPSHLYPVQLGVAPVQRLVLAVQSQSVGPADRICNNLQEEEGGETYQTSSVSMIISLFVPSIQARSILGFLPQSDQNIQPVSRSNTMDRGSSRSSDIRTFLRSEKVRLE